MAQTNLLRMKTIFLSCCCYFFVLVALAQAPTTWKTQFAKAQEYFNKNDYDNAVQTAEASLATLPKDAQEAQAHTHSLIGNSFLYKGRNDLAVEQFQKALDLYKKSIGEKAEPTADCYSHLGILFWNIGNNEEALAHLQKSLTIRQELFQENHAEVAASYNDIGLVYAQSQPFTALSYYEKALAIYQKVYPENHATIANAYTNIALIQLGQLQYEIALENLEKALQIRKAVYGEEHPNEAFTYNSMAQVYKAMGQNEKTLQLFDKALKIYEKNYGTKHPEIANTYNQMATVYLGQKSYDKAAVFCQKALIANSLDFDDADIRNNPNIANNYNPTIFLSSLLLKAKIFEELHFSKTLKLRDIKLALACLQRCDELIAHLRRLSSNKNDKLALGATAAEVYEDAIQLCLHLAEVTLARKKYEQLAFDFAEKSKSAVLLNAISDANAKEFAGLPPAVLEQEKNLKVEIAFYEQKLGEKGQNEQAVRNKLFDLNQSYDNFIKELEKKYPAYYDLKFNVKTATVQDLQGLLDSNTEVVSYFIAERSKRLYVFKVSEQNLAVYNVPLEADLQKWITILRNSMLYKATKEYLSVAYLLKKQLFPFNLHNKNYICIPDGRLGIIPFEALLAEKVQPTANGVDFSQLPYLLNKSYFSYAYSHTLLYQRLRNPAQQKSQIQSAALIAPVHFEAMKMATLKNTATEVQTIAELCNENAIQPNIFLQEKAQESILGSSAVTEADILHFATHGEVNEEYPEKSRIILSADPTKNTDGICYAAEIYNWQFQRKPQLCILSACQTGLGKITKGEGIIGLTRPLLFVGIQNIVVSFWKVADDATMELMTGFYKEALNSDYSYNEALRNAKLQLIRGKKFAHPYFWSSFVLLGR